MAIAFQTASTAVFDAATSGSLSVPSGTVDGDMLIAGVICKQGASPANITISGFTSIASSNQATTNAQDGLTTVFWRRASSEPASYTVNTNATYGNNSSLFMLRYSGVITTGSPIGTSGTATPSATTSPQTGPTLSGVGSTDMAIQVAGVEHVTWGGADITLSGPGGSWNQRANVPDNAADASNGIAVIDQLGTGTGPSWSASSTATDFLFMMIGFTLIAQPSGLVTEPSINTLQAVRRSYYF